MLRIWDCLFNEGSKMLFRVAVTLIKLNEARLLECADFGDMAECFKTILKDQTVLECHQFMAVRLLLRFPRPLLLFGFLSSPAIFIVLLAFTWLYLVSMSFIRFYLVLLAFIGSYLVLLNFTVFYRILLGFAWFYLVLLGFTEFYCFLVFT